MKSPKAINLDRSKEVLGGYERPHLLRKIKIGRVDPSFWANPALRRKTFLIAKNVLCPSEILRRGKSSPLEVSREVPENRNVDEFSDFGMHLSGRRTSSLRISPYLERPAVAEVVSVLVAFGRVILVDLKLF